MFFCFLPCSDDTSFRRTLSEIPKEHHPFFFSDRHYSHLVQFPVLASRCFRFFIFPWEVAGAFHEGNGGSRCASCARVYATMWHPLMGLLIQIFPVMVLPLWTEPWHCILLGTAVAASCGTPYFLFDISFQLSHSARARNTAFMDRLQCACPI